MNAIAFESFESRRMFAAAVTATIVNHKLTVTGTDGADAIYVELPQSGTGSVAIYSGKSGADGGTLVGAFSDKNYDSIVIDAKAGNDRVETAYDLDLSFDKIVPLTVYGGVGDDNIQDYRNNNDHALLDGGIGNDTLGGGDSIVGGAGNDLITPNTVDNHGPGPAFQVRGHFDGGDGNDTIYGSESDVKGGSGGDTIYNGRTVDAGAGNDTVYAATRGVSVVYLGAGNDRAFVNYKATHYDDYGTVGPSSITIYGDSGRDLIQATDNGGPLVTAKILKAYGGADNDTLIGANGQDLLKGDAGDDQLRGGNDNDTLDGGTGNDVLYGDAGNDQLFGSDGNDTLYGGVGNNKLYGQTGTDVLHGQNNAVDTLYATSGDNVLDRDTFDVLA